MLALALTTAGLVPQGLWHLIGLQALCAGMMAWVFRSETWWIAIHLLFAPLLLAANALSIPPGWYLLAFLAMGLVYWSSFRTGVPLFLSNAATAQAVAAILPPRKGAALLDIGSGTGALLFPLAALRPDAQLVGVESAPAPYLLSRLLARPHKTIRLHRGDFFRHHWHHYDLVYAFLSPVPMEAVGHKARLEMRPGARLVSNSFEIPGWRPEQIVNVGDKRNTRLFVYAVDRSVGASAPKCIE